MHKCEKGFEHIHIESCMLRIHSLTETESILPQINRFVHLLSWYLMTICLMIVFLSAASAKNFMQKLFEMPHMKWAWMIIFWHSLFVNFKAVKWPSVLTMGT